MLPVRIIQVSMGTLAAIALALALGSCGKVANEGKLQIDSNTNWLMRCDADDQCSGSLRCYCGQCSQPCSVTDECGLLAGAECASTGGAVCSEQPGAGGLCVLGCTEDAECGLDFACTEGQCVPQPCAPVTQSWDDIYLQIASDLARVDADDALTVRYISTANRSRHDNCESKQVAQREGLSKLVNSLSQSSVITRPTPIDADSTLYRINLRDYDWDQPVTVGNFVFTDVWEALVAADPFALPFVGDDASDVAADSGARVPVLFADSLIATATRPDMYAAILGIPRTLDELYTDLGVDAAQRATPDARAGYSEGEDLIASHQQTRTRSGFLWELAQLGDRNGTLLDDPLQPPSGGRQVVFSLPNGLNAFVYADGIGDWLEASFDFLDGNTDDFRARAPRSPLRQHWPGVRLGTDVVQRFVDQNQNQYDPLVAANILRAYPGPDIISNMLESDYEAFTRPALDEAGVNVSLPEPITLIFDEYNRDVDLRDVAGDLLVDEDQLESNLNLLAPEFQVLDGGRIDRDDFALLFRDALCSLGITLDNTPDPAVCP